MAACGVSGRRVISSFNFNCNFFPKTLCYCTITEKMCDISPKELKKEKEKKKKKEFLLKKNCQFFSYCKVLLISNFQLSLIAKYVM